MSSKECKLCSPCISSDDHDKLWYAEQRGGYPNGYEAVLEQANAIGISVTLKDIRRHFEYHRPRQAKPKARPRSNTVRRITNKLTARQKQVIDLIYRVPGLSAEEIGLMFFWNGNKDKLVSADKGGQRNLRRLQRLDMVFRCYLENLPGPDYRPYKMHGLYFFNVNARQYIEELHDIKVLPREEHFSDDSFKDWTEVWSKYRQHATIAKILNQLPGSMNNRYLDLSSKTRIQWKPENWIDQSVLRLKFKDPLRETSSLAISGMAAFNLLFDGKEILLPFLYLIDDQSRREDYLLRDINSVWSLARSGQIRDYLPEYPDPFKPLPLYIISTETSRVNEIRQLLGNNRSNKNNIIFITDSVSYKNALTDKIWIQGDGESAEKYYFVKSLFEHYRDQPWPSNSLNWRR